MANSVTRRLLLEEAARRGWKASTIGERAQFLKVTHPDGRSQLFRGSRPQQSSANGCSVSLNKNYTMDYLESEGYTVPGFRMVTSIDDAMLFLEERKRIVVKPSDGQKTEGVTVGITEPSDVPAAFQYAADNSPTGQVIVQEHLDGKLYRLLVIDGKLVAAAQRSAAAVIGDGASTVEQLLQRLNEDPRRGGLDSPLRQVDTVAARQLLGEDMSAVPAAGDTVMVSNIHNISAGGEATEVTSRVHDDWRRFSEDVTTKLQLFICGYDVICDDISRPLNGGMIPVLELNTAPAFIVHEYPTGGGEPIHLAPLLFDALFY